MNAEDGRDATSFPLDMEALIAPRTSVEPTSILAEPLFEAAAIQELQNSTSCFTPPCQRKKKPMRNTPKKTKSVVTDAAAATTDQFLMKAAAINLEAKIIKQLANLSSAPAPQGACTRRMDS
jgi:hypothetical protein